MAPSRGSSPPTASPMRTQTQHTPVPQPVSPGREHSVPGRNPSPSHSKGRIPIDLDRNRPESPSTDKADPTPSAAESTMTANVPGIPGNHAEKATSHTYRPDGGSSASGSALESSPAPMSRLRSKEGSVMSKARKYVLLAVFCLGVFIDVMGVCAFYILTGPVAIDLGIRFEAQTWIITSFAVTFAAFLLFWGRVSDLYSPTPVFAYGFLCLGLFNLVISFMNDQYSFLILRALSGIAGSCLIPASYRLITAVFDTDELPMAFTTYSLSGALGASLGVPIAGLVELIPLRGQMAGWRWFFRLTTIVILPVSLWSLKAFPKPRGEAAEVTNKRKRLDIPGTMIMLFAILLLILGLTLGASYGFGTPAFLVPFLLSLPLFPLFFWWEARLHPSMSLVPSATWNLPNFTLWIVLATFTSAWWTCNQIPMIEVYVREKGDSSIIAAVRILPEGVSSLTCSAILIAFPVICANPRWSYTIGQIGGMVAYVLFIYSEGDVGIQYWKFGFPGAVIGSFFNNIATTCVIVGAMTTSPAHQAGVVGAILQTAIQAGNAIALTVQAGLLTIHPNGIHDFRNVQASFWFMFAWGGAFLLAFCAFYRTFKRLIGEDEKDVVPLH